MQFCLSGVGALNSASDLYGALRERYSSFISPFCVLFRPSWSLHCDLWTLFLLHNLDA